jgi:hypothetical protein
MNNMKVINKGRLALKRCNSCEDDNLIVLAYNTIANFDELSEYDKAYYYYKRD